MRARPVVRLERQGRIAIVTIDRPEVRNAVDGAVAAALDSAFDELDADRSVWAVVLTGAPPVFCAGADLAMIADGRADAMTAHGFAGLTDRVRRVPLIAAVEGAAVAGGFEIVLACDLVVASRAARFGLPEVRRALVAAGGGLVRLPHRLPRNVAMELALTGATIDGARAADLGLVNRLTEPGGARQGALELAAEIVANPPIAVGWARRVLDRSAGDGEAAARDDNAAAMDAIVTTEDFREGPRAFLEKRDPAWTGR